MRSVTLVLATAVCLALSACGSKTANEKMMEKEMQNKSEVRMKLLKQYNTCVADAKGDAEKINECESLLEAAEKVK